MEVEKNNISKSIYTLDTFNGNISSAILPTFIIINMFTLVMLSLIK